MIDLDDLRKKAEAATPGPWYATGNNSKAIAPADIAYICAANPTVVLGMLDEIDRLRAELAGGIRKSTLDRLGSLWSITLMSHMRHGHWGVAIQHLEDEDSEQFEGFAGTADAALNAALDAAGAPKP